MVPPPETAKETPGSSPSLRRKEPVTPPVVRKRNNSARPIVDKKDTSSALSSEEELFEDEPDLPRASPRRIAARTARRRKPLRRSSLDAAASVSTEQSPPALPSLRTTAAARDFDDDSSHWSSSDTEDEIPPSGDVPRLSRDDIEICQKLDDEYEVALEDREVVYTARYNSVRQSACFSVFFMIFYLSLGTVFFMRQAGWTVQDSILFSIYTITTVGCKFHYAPAHVRHSPSLPHSLRCLV
jgi:hypothetical protein